MAYAASLASIGQLSDEDLVASCRRGDDDALTHLLTRYRPFVRSKARSYFLVGGDSEDIVQEGMVGLYKAVRDFDAAQGVSFRGFAELCVVRQIITAIKTATRHKHAPLNSYVSLHTTLGDRADGDQVLAEVVLGDEYEASPEERLIEETDFHTLRHHVHQLLSELETEVLERYLRGESYADIASSMHRQVKSIDNALQRVKRKVESYLSGRVVVDEV